MEENRFMKVQPVVKTQPTFTNSNSRPLFKGQLSNNTSDVDKKEFQQVLKEVKDDDKENKETNNDLKETEKGEKPQTINVLTSLKPLHKMEDPYPNPKSITPGKLNFIA